MRTKWLTLAAECEQTKAWLDSASTDFEKEARLADVQEQTRRHLEVMTKISSINISSETASIHQDPVTNVVIARNDRFKGRMAVLAQLHSELTPNFQDKVVSSRVCCSCGIDAIGGTGKTETALEYSYRYRYCYSHVFWLRAQTGTMLLESFLEVSAKLNLDEKGTAPKKIQAVLQGL